MVMETPEAGYDLSLRVDLKNVKSSDDPIFRKVAMLRRHLFAAPFERYFDLVAGNKKPEPIAIKYRDSESWYLVPQGDRLTVVFSILFTDPDDAVLAKVFLQEFIDARRHINNAPTIAYTKEPPMELAPLKLKSGWKTRLRFRDPFPGSHGGFNSWTVS